MPLSRTSWGHSIFSHILRTKQYPAEVVEARLGALGSIFHTFSILRSRDADVNKLVRQLCVLTHDAMRLVLLHFRL